MVEAGHRAVRMDGQLPGGGERRNAQRIGNAARLGQIRLQDRNGAVLQHPIEFEARVMVFAGGKGRAAVGARLAVTPVVMRRKRLLKPADAELVHRRHYPTHIVETVADVGVGEDDERIAEFVAHRAQALDVALG